MTDPRLQSIHLEFAPRRDNFRRARLRVEEVLGEHTIAGELCLPHPGSRGDLTLVPGSNAATPTAVCWLLDRGKQISLKIGLNTVGRLPDNDVVIDDATISRRHCAIVVHSDLSVELHDIASKNGTTINGTQLASPTRLHDGDEIALCDRKLIFVMNSGSPTLDKIPIELADLSDENTQVG